MRLTFPAAIAVAFAFGGVAQAAKAPQDIETAINDLRLAYLDGSCVGDRKRVEKTLVRPDAGTASAASLSMLYLISAMCALEDDDAATAIQRLVTASAHPNAPDYIWSMRFRIQESRDLDMQAVETAEAVAQAQPSALREIDDKAVDGLLRRLIKSGGPLKTRFLKVLMNDAYERDDPFEPKDFFRRLYVADLTQTGDVTEARRIIATLESIQLRLVASLDRRYAAAFEGEVDPRLELERNLLRDKALAAASPDRLDGAKAVTSGLRRLGRAEEAVAYARSYEARLLAAAPNDPSPFKEGNAGESLFWDDLALSLQQVGRFDDAVTALRRGATLGPKGVVHVTPTIDLANLLLDLNRPDEALKALSAFTDEGALDYFMAQVWADRVCAYVQKGDATSAQALARDPAPAAANRDAGVKAALCRDDSDTAAALLVQQLTSEDYPGEALYGLSRFRPTPNTTAWRRGLEARRLALADRPDVKAAIAQAGRTGTFDIVNSY
jgi:tetratricopeptide (TPR) repeat protein